MISEPDIENLLEQQLIKNGWDISINSPNRNVFHQIPRTEAERKKLDGCKPDFCLYLTPNSPSPEIIIETKKPNTNLSAAKKQALKYATLLSSKIIILFDGLYVKSF